MCLQLLLLSFSHVITLLHFTCVVTLVTFPPLCLEDYMLPSLCVSFLHVVCVPPLLIFLQYLKFPVLFVFASIVFDAEFCL